MSEAGQAPGPWGYGERQGPRSVVLKRRHWVVGVNHGKGVAIAFGDDETNARLIAAAPDLLEALKLALPKLPHALSCARVLPSEEWDTNGSISFDNCKCIRDTVLAAIEKAVGYA